MRMIGRPWVDHSDFANPRPLMYSPTSPKVGREEVPGFAQPPVLEKGVLVKGIAVDFYRRRHVVPNQLQPLPLLRRERLAPSQLLASQPRLKALSHQLAIWLQHRLLVAV